MSILNRTSVQKLQRLLDLYPVSSLRAEWPKVNGTKTEVCFEIAGQRDVPKITQFLDEHLDCCKQHIYVFEHRGKLDALPAIGITDADRILETATNDSRRFFFVIDFEYNVVLRDPLEEATIEFLWPLRIDFFEKYMLVRFVILEKNIGSYVEGRSYYVDRKSTEEKAVLAEIQGQLAASLGLQPADLHKGVKALWENGIIDSPKARYKKAFSTAAEAMDEDYRIREHDPDLFEIMLESPLFNSIFEIADDQDLSVSMFSVDPSKGYIAFSRYSDNAGDTDYVIREILRHND